MGEKMPASRQGLMTYIAYCDEQIRKDKNHIALLYKRRATCESQLERMDEDAKKSGS